MHRPDFRHASTADYTRHRRAPPVVVSLALALLPPALVAAAAHPGTAAVATGAAFTAGATLGFLTGRR